MILRVLDKRKARMNNLKILVATDDIRIKNH